MWRRANPDSDSDSGRVSCFQVDAGRKISEGKRLLREFERNDSGLHNSR